ncbi:dihydropteroate synthase [Arthrospiribacter ruber]|uniref:dihydropteroate synthase n=1 Tax=Arthrospiribacter ruber TaxID=2487934 RepID=A0A951IUE1_9BACT|nr:dihydropteroate synthase [Arthrospiribacter ruber]MBW3466306.1 dihydropteroate synthase [Arthrospiribacter ruber]
MSGLFNNSSDFEDIVFPPKKTLTCRGKLVFLDKPKIMGILNVTPDSFYQESRLDKNTDLVKRQANKMVQEGADILDIGGYSSRPGADEVSLQEELDRVIPAIEAIRESHPDVLLSIDTFRSQVAIEAIASGGDMVNDISAGQLDPDMIPAVGHLSVPYIAMHMRGNPKSMQEQTEYGDILLEISKYFSEKVEVCYKAGIKDVIIDPGFGFSKTLEQNYWILKNLSYFKNIHTPILVGLSRKSMIYKKLDLTPKESLNGTTALNMFSLIQGANILRVHDVKEAKQTLTLYKQLYP